MDQKPKDVAVRRASRAGSRIVQHVDLPLEWLAQRQKLGFP
jgi:hypothetical protein